MKDRLLESLSKGYLKVYPKATKVSPKDCYYQFLRNILGDFPHSVWKNSAAAFMETIEDDFAGIKTIRPKCGIVSDKPLSRCEHIAAEH